MNFGVLRYILVNFVILCGIMRNFGNYAEKGQLCGSASAHNSGMPVSLQIFCMTLEYVHHLKLGKTV